MKRKIKRKVFYLITILLIFLMTIIILKVYASYSNQSIILLAEQTFQKNVYSAFNNTIKKVLKDDLEDIF